jgi:chromatin remodeling complex protein RSC6
MISQGSSAGASLDSPTAADNSSSQSDTCVVLHAGSNLENKLSMMQTKIAEMKDAMRGLDSMFRALNKECTNMIKTMNKKTVKKTVRPISGITKKTILSDKMYEFLNIPKGTEVARVEVTKLIHAYIKDHSLQNPQDKRIIVPDEKMRSIVGDHPHITYFNLQKFLSPHITTSTTKATASTSAASVAPLP